MARLARRTLVALVVVIAGLLLFIAVLWLAQRQLIYFPDAGSPPLRMAGPGWEAVTYSTSDGVELTAWYKPPEAGRPVVVVFNGNAGNRGGRAGLGAGLADSGLGVLLTDYRGYGGNLGRPTEEGLARDAQAAATFLKGRAPGRPVVYFGESLGAAVAIQLATVEPPAVLVLRSPFTSMSAMGREHYPWLPVTALLKDRYPSIDRIPSVKAPVLVVAGDADSIVPVRQSRAIFEAAPGSKRLVVIPGADHNDLVLVAGPGMIGEVVSFIDAALE